MQMPDAFLSFTRFDDRRGRISDFCRELSETAVEFSGESFNIFQDVEGIGIGGHWPDKLDEMLQQARFFIPIITPKFFKSERCRDELTGLWSRSGKSVAAISFCRFTGLPARCSKKDI